MSITKLQRARLGIFMIAGCVLLVLFIAIPVGFRLNDKTEIYYSVFGKGESVSGLVEGAEVKYNGVRIGNIEEILLNPDDFTKIKVFYRIDRNKIAITEGMEARTGLMGITGLLYIEITGGAPDAKVLKEGSEIPSKPSLMHTITGKAEDIVVKVELLLNHLNMLTDPDNITSINKTLKHVEGVTSRANQFMENLTPKADDIVVSARSIMSKVDAISTDIKSITGKIDRDVDLGQFARIMDQIDSTAKAMKNLSENLDMTIKQSREDITISMENLRETLENTNELSKLLMENPSLILKGESQKERRLK